MSRKNYVVNKGRSRKERFIRLPHKIVQSEAYRGLNPPAVVILLHMLEQFNGSNNGLLRATKVTMQGLNVKGGSIARGRDELEAVGLIVQTQSGKRPNIASLYALSWIRINGGNHGYQRDFGVKEYWKNGFNPEYEERKALSESKPKRKPTRKQYQAPNLTVVSSAQSCAT